MGITVRPANLEQDQDILTDTLARYLNPLCDDRRFLWLYWRHGHKPVQAWLAVNTEQNSVCGAAAAFPRLFYSDNEETLSWVLGDSVWLLNIGAWVRHFSCSGPV